MRAAAAARRARPLCGASPRLLSAGAHAFVPRGGWEEEPSFHGAAACDAPPWLRPTAHDTTRGADGPGDDDAAAAALGPPRVHATAVVERGARLAPGCVVGPHAFVSAGAQLGAGCAVGPGAAVLGDTTLGPRCLLRSGAVVGAAAAGTTRMGVRCVVGHAAVVGAQCPDLKHRSGATHIALGDRCDVREHAALHRSSAEHGATRIGARCLLMGGVHVGHDAQLGDNVIAANGVLLAGHVSIGAGAVLGGGAAAQQHVRIGRWAFVAGGAMVEGDVPDCMRAKGDRAELQGVNTEGLRRAGWAAADVAAAARAAGALYRGAPEGAGPATHAALARRAAALLAPGGEFGELAAAHAASAEGAPPALLLLRSVHELASRGEGRGPAAWRASLRARVAALEAALAELNAAQRDRE